jgi:DNA-directed RNA polymerase subunit M/transcription elongation factor TFIIS
MSYTPKQKYSQTQSKEMGSILNIMKNFPHIKENLDILKIHLYITIEEIQDDVINSAITKFYELYPGEGELDWNNENFVIVYGSLFSNLKVHMNPNSTVESKYIMSITARYVAYKHKISYYSTEVNKFVSFIKDDKTRVSIGNNIMKYITPYANIASLGGISSLKPREMCTNLSELVKKIENHKEDTVKKRCSELYPCPKCHTRRANVERIQIRSLDEGESLALECDHCGFKWVIV